MAAKSTYQIITIAPNQFADIEQLGSKDKFWFWLDDEKWLFKEARVIPTAQGDIFAKEMLRVAYEGLVRIGK